jgi:1-deoxy-D-xylulose-5-phosphate synthase
LRYIGPVDGNNLDELVPMLERVSKIDGPLILHVTTRKGAGYLPAEEDPQRYHGVSKLEPDTGFSPVSGGRSFSSAFGDKMVEMAEKHPDLEAVSAAMIPGTGLSAFYRKYPLRCHDVGIAEEHAVIFSAGLASGKRRPVCAVYSTFIQRAFDCIYCEVVLNRFPVIFAIDRAGAVEDGPTHHGIYDLGFLRQLPDFPVMTPANEEELGRMLELAYELNVPCAIRYPRGKGAENTEGVPLEFGKNSVVRSGSRNIVIWAMGREVDTALQTADLLGDEITVIAVKFVSPFDLELVEKYRHFRHFTVEDHSVCGGLYSTLCEALSGREHGAVVPFGWPSDKIVCHGKVEELRQKYGLTACHIAEVIRNGGRKYDQQEL